MDLAQSLSRQSYMLAQQLCIAKLSCLIPQSSRLAGLYA